LLLVIPLRMQKTNSTAAQVRLAKKYRVYESPKQRSLSQFPPLVEWTMPMDAWQLAASKARRAVIPMAVRLVGLVTLISVAAQVWLSPVIDKGFSWLAAYGIMLGFTAIAIAARAAEAGLIVRPKPPSYGISNEGVLVPSKDRPLIRWNELVSFSVGPDDLSPQRIIVTIYSKAGHHRPFTLPEGTIGDEVLEHFNTHLPQGPPPPQNAKLRTIDWIAGFAVCTLVVLAGGSSISQHAHALKQSGVLDWIMIGGLVFGPGTWIALCLFRRRAKAQLFGFAVIFNFFCTIITLMAAVVRSLH
jgi:hypothetical protein